MATVDKRILIRMGKELTDLEQTPPLGVACYPVNDNIVHLQAGRERQQTSHDWTFRRYRAKRQTNTTRL